MILKNNSNTNTKRNEYVCKKNHKTIIYHENNASQAASVEVAIGFVIAGSRRRMFRWFY